MKECDKRKSHISSELHLIYIIHSFRSTYLVIMLDNLLLRPSLHFTALHPTTLNSTSLLPI